MKHYVYRSVLCAMVFAFAIKTSAQELRSSYFMKTSTFRHQLNPALADQAYFGLLFGNTNIATRGNIGLSNFVYKLDNNSDYDLTTFMSPEVSADEFLGKLHDKNRISVNVNYNLLSVGFKGFRGVNVIEINMKSNTALSLPYELFEFMKKTGEKEHYSFKNLGAKSLNYLEVGFGHSHKISNNLTIGGKLKVLSGIAYAKFDVDYLDLTLNEDVWTINGNTKFSAAVMKSKFKYDDDPDPDTTDSSRGDKVIGMDDVGFGTPGFGLALDLGFTYKVACIDGLTVSGALTDFGRITWKNTNTASSKGTWEFDGFNNPIYATGEDTGDNKIGDQLEALGDDLKKVFSVYDDGQKSESSSLAATLSLAAEYEMPFYHKLSAGILFTKRFDGIFSSHQTTLACNYRPLKFVEASLDISSTSEGLTFGGMLSLYTKGFNLFVGSDSFLGKVSKEYIPLHNGNANLAFGINFPL
ncbi:MAG: hypothetical protein H6Q14_2375 [Bacteroidetes bacterium]|nr:hypothetical protein [Bacteroidota bacterium]